METMLSQLS